MGRLLDKQRAMAKRLINNGGYEVDITFVLAGVIVKGLATNHYNSIDSDGIAVISKNSHITVNESDLTDKGIIVRDSNNLVKLTDTIISYADSTGVVKTYTIGETMPNETLGHIVCFLTDVTIKV